MLTDDFSIIINIIMIIRMKQNYQNTNDKMKKSHHFKSNKRPEPLLLTTH